VLVAEAMLEKEKVGVDDDCMMGSQPWQVVRLFGRYFGIAWASDATARC